MSGLYEVLLNLARPTFTVCLNQLVFPLNWTFIFIFSSSSYCQVWVTTFRKLMIVWSFIVHVLVSSQQFLYGTSTRHLSYNDFINKELILFSNSDNERSIPSLVDGVYLQLCFYMLNWVSLLTLSDFFSLFAVLIMYDWSDMDVDWLLVCGASELNVCFHLLYAGLKPGARKVLFTCMKRNDKREVKVAQLAGSVAEMSAYHHGEVCSKPFFALLLLFILGPLLM